MIYVQCACSTYLLSLLSSLQVTWLKREQNNSHIQLLTIGVHTYTFDKRFSVEFEYPNNWRLRIADTNKSDEGLYVKTSIPLENCASQLSLFAIHSISFVLFHLLQECQISTHPPRAIRTQFNVKCK